MADTSSDTSSSTESKRPGMAQFVPFLVGALTWPLAPVWPMETALVACFFGFVYGYVRWPAPARARMVLYGMVAFMATAPMVRYVMVNMPTWESWAALAGMFFGLTAGWWERDSREQESAVVVAS